jgi:hypothetical protein
MNRKGENFMATEFHHFGVPTQRQSKGETYLEGGKLFLTDPEAHPYRVEFLRFDADSPMPEALSTQPHAAFMVDDLEAAIEGQEIVLEPFDATDTLRVAFIKDGDALIEVMESTG